jgi:hypothetical protein
MGKSLSTCAPSLGNLGKGYVSGFDSEVSAIACCPVPSLGRLEEVGTDNREEKSDASLFAHHFPQCKSLSPPPKCIIYLSIIAASLSARPGGIELGSALSDNALCHTLLPRR